MKSLQIWIVGLFLLLFSSTNGPAQTLIWAKSMGNTYQNYSKNIAIEGAGNVYSIGNYSNSMDFDPGPGVYNLPPPVSGVMALYLTKFNASGNLVWAKQLRANILIEALDIAIDPFGNIYFSFLTQIYLGQIDVDPGSNLVYFSTGFFVEKLDPFGNYLWAKRLSNPNGTFSANESFLTTDISGNVIVSGKFTGTMDFDPGIPFYNMTVSGAYFLKLNPLGNFIWAKKFDNLNMTSTVTDEIGNIITAGFYNTGVDFDPGPGSYSLSLVGGRDGFVSKLDSNGNFVWAKGIGSIQNDQSNSVVTDISGNVFITGQFVDTVDFDPGIGIYNLYSCLAYTSDIFLLKLDAAGNFVYAKKFGSAGTDRGTAITIDPFQNPVIEGYFTDTLDFDPNSGVLNIYAAPGYHNFICKMSNSGNLLWAVSHPDGFSFSLNKNLCVDGSGAVILSGNYKGQKDFDSGPGIYNLTSSSTTISDIFFLKLDGDSSGNTQCSANFSLQPSNIPHSWNALNHSTGLAPVSYVWNWGDGDTSHGAYPSHNYANPGQYAICLTVNDAAGCTTTYCDSTTYLQRNATSTTIVTINVINPLSVGVTPVLLNSSRSLIFPNPVNSLSTISLFLEEEQNAVIELFDMSGRVVQIISSMLLKKGENKIVWDATKLNSGIYFLKLDGENFTETKKVIVLN